MKLLLEHRNENVKWLLKEKTNHKLFCVFVFVFCDFSETLAGQLERIGHFFQLQSISILASCSSKKQFIVFVVYDAGKMYADKLGIRRFSTEFILHEVSFF